MRPSPPLKSIKKSFFLWIGQEPLPPNLEFFHNPPVFNFDGSPYDQIQMHPFYHRYETGNFISDRTQELKISVALHCIQGSPTQVVFRAIGEKSEEN